MQTANTSETDAKTVAHLLSASLKPADAGASREALLAALAEARAADTGLELELDGDGVMPCSLQLLVAAEQSAAAAGTPLQFGPRAQSARETLSIPQTTEHEAK